MDVTEQHTPTLAETLLYAIESRLAVVRTAIPASIISYDSVTGKAELKLNVKTVFEDGEQVDMANISNVIVAFPRSNGGDSYLTFPLKAGDTGQYIICDRSIDNWKERGGTTKVDDFRRFDINDGIFYPGASPFDNPINPSDSTRAYFRNEKAQVELEPSGKVAIKGFDGAQVVEVLQQISETLQTLLDAKVATSIGLQPFDPATLIKLTNTKLLIDGIKG